MNIRDELELLEQLAKEQGLMLSDELINFAERLIQEVLEGWEDPSDYVGMGWVDGNGRP